jgi:hypothetical protein
MDYGELLGRSWRLVWNHKFLIALGFLAALGSGTYSGNFSYSMSEEERSRWFGDWLNFSWEQAWPLLAGVICLILFLIVLFWLIRLAGQGALIAAASRLNRGEPETFTSAMRQGMRVTPRLAGVDLLLFGPFVVTILLALLAGIGWLVIIPVNSLSSDFSSQAEAVGVLFVLCLCVFLCAWFPLLLLAGIIHGFAQCSVVLDGQGVFASIGAGWRTVRNHPGQVLVLLLLLLLIGAAFGIVTAAITVPLALVLVAPLIISLGGGASAGALLAAAIGFVIVAIVAAAITSFLKAFQRTVIALAYEQFNARAPKPEVMGDLAS